MSMNISDMSPRQPLRTWLNFAKRISSMALTRPWVQSLFVGVACFALEIAIVYPSIQAYYPSGDDIPMIVNSTSYAGKLDATRWITSGFSQYCLVHPEIAHPNFNFVRPVFNAVFWVSWCMFGDSWGSYLYTNCFVHAVACAIAFWLARGFLNIPLVPSLIAAAVMFVTPSIGALLGYITWAQDQWGAVLAGVALLFVLRERWVFAILVLAAALFTKEPNVFAPVAAAITFILVRRGRQSLLHKQDYIPAALLLLLPLALWLSVRFVFFRGFDNCYAVNGGATPLTFAVRAINGALLWPTGLLSGSDVPSILAQGMSLSSLVVILGLLANAASVVGMLALLACLRNPLTRRKYASELALLPWFCGILAVVTILGLGLRYGYAVYLFGIPLAVAIGVKSRRLPVRLLAGAFLAAITVHGVICFPIQQDFGDWQRARKLVAELRANGDKYDRIYLLNDFVARYGGGCLRQFAKTHADIVIVNGISSSPSPGMLSTEVNREGGGCYITVRVKKPTELILRAVSVGNLLENHSVLKVGNTREYEFPEYRCILSRSKTYTREDWGSVMKVRIKDTSHYALLDYDSVNQSFILR